MLLSTFPPQTPFSTTQSNYSFTPICPCNYAKHLPQPHSPLSPCRATANTSAQRSLPIAATSSTSIRHVSGTCDEDEESMVPSAAAIAAAIRGASTSPVDFVQQIEKFGSHGGAKNKAMVLPSQDFQRLCVEQLDLFRRIVDSNALLSVYVRPAGSYVMDRLELRRITFYPGVHTADIVVLVGNFSMPAGLRVAEAAISRQQAEIFPELGAVVFPLVTHPFVVGFLVAELPKVVLERDWLEYKQNSYPGQSFRMPRPRGLDSESVDVQTLEDHSLKMLKFTPEQKLNAINITRSLAMAYVMDQKALLLQQSSWQNNIRMNNLVEQIRDSLSNIRTLSKLLSVHTKRSEISYDIVEDILVQGDHMRDTLHQLQDAVYFTKANLIHYNNENLKKMQQKQSETIDSQSSNSLSMESSVTLMQEPSGRLSLRSSSKDLEFPMPPLALASSFKQGIRRPCKVSDVLEDLVGAIKPLAQKQRRVVELCDLSRSLEVAVEEPALRQALSNLIEGALLRSGIGGRIEIVSTEAPAGGSLVIIDDDGPDMHYMTQMHSLTPFGADLYAEDRIEDNMTWNFVAGLTVAREILESYGCVVRVISPRQTNPAMGAGGTRIELWLPTLTSSQDAELFAQEA